MSDATFTDTDGKVKVRVFMEGNGGGGGGVDKAYVDTKIAAVDPSFLEPRVTQLESTTVDVNKRDFAVSKLATAVFDEFNRSDTILNGSTALSGHAWSVSGPGQNIAKIKDGALISDGSNFYASLEYGATVKYMQAAFSFEEQTGVTSGVADNITLIMQGGNVDLLNMIHLVCSVSNFTLTKRLSGGDFIVVPLTRTSDVPYMLRADGTPYNTSMFLEGNKLTIIDATGVEYTSTDNDFLTINPHACTIQIGPQPNAQYSGKFHSISIGKKSVDARFQANNGSSKVELVPIRNDIAWLAGPDLSFVHRQRIEDVVISANGWYTIATNQIYGGKLLGGKIRLNSKDSAGRVTVCEAQINSTFIDLYNIGILVGAGAITQIRRRVVSGDSFIDFYFPSATTNPVTFTADFEGFFTPVIPSAIASDTGSSSFNTKAIVIPTVSEISFDATVNGYYTLAIQVAKSFGFVLYGKATVEVSNSAGYVVFDIVFKNASILTAANVFKSAVSPVNDVRVTGDASNVHLDINLTNAATNTTTVKIRFDKYGLYSVVMAPVSGAVELTTTIHAAI